MRQNLLILALLSLFHTIIYSQNLVSNPSFEELVNLPVKPNPKNTFEYEPNSGFQPFRKNLKFWFAGTLTTPDLRIFDLDYYRKCDKLFDDCDRPRTGSMMVGLITSLRNTYTDSYREYVQIKLNKALEVGEMTYVELWIRREREAKLVSNNIGFHFAMEQVFESTEEVLELRPQINYDQVVNADTTKWVKITGKFKPARPYRYVLIGNFFKNEATTTLVYPHYSASVYVPPYAYYLIDDIKIWQNEASDTNFGESLNPRIGETIVLESIYFQTDSTRLEPPAIEELEKLYAFLQQHPEQRIAIYGHTDNVAPDHYNLTLSQGRAEAVVNYLINKGIDPVRLSATGYGETQPIDTNDTEEGRQKNRRVELELLD